MRTVALPATGKVVSLGAYVRAVRRAKANPDLEFAHGLDCWWPCTGREVVRQFRKAMHARISAAVPYRLRGR